MKDWFGFTREHTQLRLPAARIRSVLRAATADTPTLPREVMPARPITLPRGAYAELFRAGHTILDLLRRTALALGPATAQRLAAIGANHREYPLFTQNMMLEERYAACMARPDVVVGPNGPMFIEFNVSGVTGGVVDLHCLLSAWRFLYGTQMATPFVSHDPFEARSALFSDVCTELDLPRRLAWVGSVRMLKHTQSSRRFDLELEHLHSRGFIAKHFEPEDLDRAEVGGAKSRFPLGLRHLTVTEWLERGIDIAPVRRALDRGCLLLAPQTSAFVANKKTLGMVSEGLPWMSTAERELVDRYVPWTRVLADRYTTLRGTKIDLVPHTLAHQQSLVIKGGSSMQGRDVVIGYECPSPAWVKRVDDAVARGDSVVQQYVEPARYPLELTWSDDDPADVVEVAPVLSPFLFGGRPAGVFARFFSTGAAGVVSRTEHGAMENAVVMVA